MARPARCSDGGNKLGVMSWIGAGVHVSGVGVYVCCAALGNSLCDRGGSGSFDVLGEGGGKALLQVVRPSKYLMSIF